ncbi:unnamed protein product, partial [Chrysoparadoxa australica]
MLLNNRNLPASQSCETCDLYNSSSQSSGGSWSRKPSSTPVRIYVFQNKLDRKVVVVDSMGGMATAKAVHTMRSMPDVWEELDQIAVDDALEQSKEKRLEKAGGEVAGCHDGWREGEMSQGPSEGVTCTWCGVPVATEEIYEQHKVICEHEYQGRSQGAALDKEMKGFQTDMEKYWASQAAAGQQSVGGGDCHCPEMFKEALELVRRTANLSVTSSALFNEGAVLIADLEDAAERCRSEMARESNNGGAWLALAQEGLRKSCCAVENKMAVARELTELKGNSKLSGAVRLSDFNIIKPIGSGGSAEVFLARKKGTGDVYAIKVMSKAHIADMDMSRRVMKERKIMSLIGTANPYVVKLYFAFRSAEFLSLVMEYMHGGSLQTLLDNVVRLKVEAARTYTAELVLCLEFLHSHGIVHRDLKPDNILISSEGHVKVMDFGLSYCAEKETGGVNGLNIRPLSKEGKLYSPVGTCQYLAVEVILKAGHGAGVDWWSLGVLLFHFLTGRTPFDASNVDKIFDNITSNSINWDATKKLDLPESALDLISALLNPNPSVRLGSNGAAEVKAHPFFDDVDWDMLHKRPGPFVPQLKDDEDASYAVSNLKPGRADPGVGVDWVEGRVATADGAVSWSGDEAAWNSFSYVNFGTRRNLLDPKISSRLLHEEVA